MNEHTTDISNVLIIGSGGAGLRAAIEVKLAGLSVSVLGKRDRNDVHTALAAGGINAALANVDEQDSWEQHFADTYLEGYGIGDPEIIEIMSTLSPNFVQEIDKWGANFEKLDNGKLDQRFFGAHTYRRTCYSGDYTGESILKALLNKSKSLNIPINDTQYVTDLLIKDNTCFGAMSFDIKKAERTVHLADAVILCTGGHTRIWKKSSSRKLENNGDGYYLAAKVGCDLVDMEMVQFHPTGMLLPEDIAGTLVTEAVRGEGGKLFNRKGERFMNNYDKKRMELSTRDIVALANYTEIIEGRGSENGGVYLDISHKSKEFILNKIPKIYRQFIEYQMIDISKVAMEVAPTAHYSMGGISVSPEEHSTSVRGLYAAGEVAGGLHGANRLGGNSLAEILVFGKMAGKAAANYSKGLKILMRSSNAIKASHENINKRIKNGTNIGIFLNQELREIMWKKCGVVKEESNLKEGLELIRDLKKKSNNTDIILKENDCSDLISSFDLEASIFSAEATILSSIERKESRGSHQRSDFNSTNNLFNCNFLVKIQDDQVTSFKRELKPLKNKLNNIIKQTGEIKTFTGKLIE